MTSARLPPAVFPSCGSAACGSATGSTAAALRRRLFGFACFTSFFTSLFLAATRQPFVKQHDSASLPSSRCLRKPDDLARDVFGRLTLGVDIGDHLQTDLLA